MPGSIAVPVRAAVVDGLTTLLAGSPEFNGTGDGAEEVEVTYAYDHTTNASQRIFTRSATAETPPASLRAGRNYKDESGQFFLVILAAIPGGSTRDAADRAHDIGVAVEEWLGDRKNNELGVDGLLTLTVRGVEDVDLGNDRGHMVERTYRVEYTARIT